MTRPQINLTVIALVVAGLMALVPPWDVDPAWTTAGYRALWDAPYAGAPINFTRLGLQYVILAAFTAAAVVFEFRLTDDAPEPPARRSGNA
jgi:hypothetical protein